MDQFDATAPVSAVVFRSEHLTEGKIAVDEDRATLVFSPYSGRVIKLLAKPGDAVRVCHAGGENNGSDTQPCPRTRAGGIRLGPGHVIGLRSCTSSPARATSFPIKGQNSRMKREGRNGADKAIRPEYAQVPAGTDHRKPKGVFRAAAEHEARVNGASGIPIFLNT